MTSRQAYGARGRGTRTFVLGGDEGLRRAFLCAAHSLFTRHGYDGVSMEQIAKSLDSCKPLLYRLFGSKDALRRAIGRSLGAP